MNFLKKLITYIDVVLLKKYLDNKFWQFENWEITEYRLQYKVEKTDLIKRIHWVADESNLNKDDIHLKHFTDVHSEYIYLYDFPVVLETRFYWLVNLKSSKIIPFSKHNFFDPWGRTDPVPSVLAYLFPRKKYFEKIIINATNYDWFNYYHFFFDVLPTICKLKEIENYQSIKLVVPKEIKNVSYIQEFMGISNLFEGVKILYVEKDSKVYAQQAYNLRMPYMNKAIINQILDSINFQKEEIDVPLNVFITRSLNRSRTLNNITEIEKIAQTFGFAIVDTDGWSLKRQITFFGKVKNVIGLHGAGMSNLMFGKNSIEKVFEIMPGDLNPQFYADLCKEFDFAYLSVHGDSRGRNENFYLNPEAFKSAIQNYF